MERVPGQPHKSAAWECRDFIFIGNLAPSRPE